MLRVSFGFPFPLARAAYSAWRNPGVGQSVPRVCAEQPKSLCGNVLGWQLGQTAEQQLFNPSKMSVHVKEEGCIFVHTSCKSWGEEPRGYRT